MCANIILTPVNFSYIWHRKPIITSIDIKVIIKIRRSSFQLLRRNVVFLYINPLYREPESYQKPGIPKMKTFQGCPLWEFLTILVFFFLFLDFKKESYESEGYHRKKSV